MNYHPRAAERGWPAHKEAWLDEETFKAAKAIKDAHAAGAYKGNAHAALAALLRGAHAAGKAGQGNGGYPAGQAAAWWATYILTVCRIMVWYDWGALTAKERLAKGVSTNLPTGESANAV